MSLVDLYAENPFTHKIGEKVMGFNYFRGRRFICGTIVDRKHSGTSNAYIIKSEYNKHDGTLYDSEFIPYDENILLRELKKDKMLTIRFLFDFGFTIIVEKDGKEIFSQEIKGVDIDTDDMIDDMIDSYKKLLEVLGYKPLLDEMYLGDGLIVLKFENEKEI